MRLHSFLRLFPVIHLANCLKWDDISGLRDADGLIEVTDDNYQFLSKGPREFYSALYVTTSQANSEGEVCKYCDLFEGNARKVSLAMLTQLSEEASREVFFFMLDISKCRSFVEEIGLKTIPHMLIYPPYTKDDNFAWSSSQFYQFHITDESARDPLLFADYFAKILNVYIQVTRDFDVNEFACYFSAFLVSFFVLKKKILPRIPNKPRFFSLVFTLAIIFTSITGYKFTKMNNIPLIAKDGQGQIMFFSGGMGWQFGIEILSVTGMYMGLGACTVGMILLPRLKLNNGMFNLVSIILLVLGFYGFAYFTQCFKIKQPDYPSLV
ncbi:LADA_0G08526g1_1 [Lachancea dasiensis]|uniref:LADA_0G08526g1_1 n=1 Tax=Lachancea dasiensis TaxID=1072105 RepID=A0A1G4JU63_9SACH|nr:LADA_0G08526g1_1 [Lachancea dasiensis]